MAIDLYIDMDGTLAYFNNKIDCYERLYEKDYFYNLSPIENVVGAVNLLLNINEDDINIYLLSACVNKDAVDQKNKWIDNYIPQLPIENRIFMTINDNKSSHIKNKTNTNILIDDYNKNLLEFHNGKNQIGIKLVNDINDVNKSWKGQRIDYRTSPVELMHQIRSLALKEVFKQYNIPLQHQFSIKDRVSKAEDSLQKRNGGNELERTEKKEAKAVIDK